MSEHDQERPKRSRRWLRKALLFGGVVFIAGGVSVELFLRARYGLGNPPVILSDPTMEYRNAPGGHYVRLGNHIDFNAFSMRSDEFPAKKSAPAERRVIVLGDSVINGGAPTDQAQLATSILQARLRKDLGTPATVGNVSAGSWGPQNLLAYVKRFGLFDADVVVIVVSSHDATDVIGPLPADEHVNSPTYLLAMQEAAERVFGRSSAAAEPAVKPAAATVDPSEAAPCLAAFDSILSAIEAAHAKPIVVLHDERGELSAPAEPRGHTLFREVAERHGVTAVSLKQAFQQSLDAGQDPYRDHIHPNAIGQQVLADVLTPLVEAALRSPTPSAASTMPATRP